MSEPKFKPNEEQYDLGAIRYAEESLRRGPAGGQALQISSDAPLRCSKGGCGREIVRGQPFVVVSMGDGRAILAHGACLGIHTGGYFDDPAYWSHIAGRVVSGLRS